MKNQVGLYLITPENFNLLEFEPLFDEALATGTVGLVQLRLKNLSDNFIISTTKRLLNISKIYNVPLIINDRPDLAKKTNANGVHIGQSDGSIKNARKLVGEDSIIGVTCHNSLNLACKAEALGADYVAFGSFYKSNSKKTRFHAEPDILEWWNKISNIPCVAIGGIDQSNFKLLVDKGAKYLAIISSVWSHPEGPGIALREFTSEMTKLTIKS